ncbi:peptide/nickel transport system permease protein/glutathione transport system permease protein [Sinosporangium album]|uniref:Peptide/nickel transport system permease protein/glutathione transport system permease protein n=1 Tax=Sinosporangium album TaxID=504805 RepID=A0A1G7YUB6_9ACTN|nr:ABC transporter permease [Sinosporangium album]SDH00061.1 peptide/nickel transport system permease protein/glutathione transport system permease protein [Sinosporangium album]
MSAGRLHFVVGRLAQVFPVLAALLLIVVLLQQMMPGDPARVIAGPRATAEQVVQVRHELGLDRPIFEQFGRHVSNLLQGDLGTSNRTGIPITTIVGDRIGVTVWLLFGGLLVSTLLAMPAALLMALRPRSRGARICSRALTIIINCPPFWVGLMLASVLALGTGWLPVGGFGVDFGDRVRSMILPSLTIGLAVMPLLARSAAASLSQVLTADHVTTARSLGVSGWPLVRRHLLRNALPPAITLLAIQAAALLFGAVIVEQTFGLPGLGAEMITAASQRDFPVVQALTLIFGLAIIGINLLADLAVALLDPRTTWR